ncbi:hypothetical protein [Leptonema illini]|uniref:Integrase catalytic region n=1 Tax=Leptonema illini DSM 21528 TaxID=929563 RepID=H2CHK8_9LEPT|nr:hypothetical protein [Leptonema illini]EHQ04831.1 Integrase catalytic region [Leptonema illini DSM 21528]
MQAARPLIHIRHKRKKASYATLLIFKAQNGLLTREEEKIIPRSTFHEWKHKDLSGTVGFDPDEPFLTNIDTLHRISENSALLKTNEAILRVIDFYRTVLDSVRGNRRIWKENRIEIVNLIASIKDDIGFNRACQMLRISTQKYYRWMRQSCTSSAIGLCRRLHPAQLTHQEQKVLKDYVTDGRFRFWSLTGIYYRMMTDGKAFMSKNTFFSYARAFQKERHRFRKQARRIGIRATAPFRLLHMDTTILRTLDGTRVYIHFIKDNFSRAILGWVASLDATSLNPARNLIQVCEKFNLFHREIDLMCDDGTENKGEVSVFLERDDVRIRRVIAQIEVYCSNSMSEAGNKTMKYEYLFPQKPYSYHDVIRILEKAVPEFNSRPHGQLYGLSPDDVLAGKMPDKRLFREKIEQARANRPEINRNQVCGIC